MARSPHLCQSNKFNSQDIKYETGMEGQMERKRVKRGQIERTNKAGKTMRNKHSSNTKCICECLCLSVFEYFFDMSYLYSWVWSCSTVPGHWELSNIQWQSIPPAYNLGCTQSESLHQQQSCCPYGGHFGAQGLSCTGWHWFVVQLRGRREKERVITHD